MILAIDIGNTNIVVGCIDDRKTYFIERLSTNRTKTELEYAVDRSGQMKTGKKPSAIHLQNLRISLASV